MLIGVALILCGRALSAQASFSNEGDKIYLIPVDGFGKLWIIDAVTHQSKSVSLGKSLAQANIDSLAIGPKGEVYVSAAGALWLWKEGDKDVTRLAKAGYIFRNGETLKTNIIVLVPLNERPIINCSLNSLPELQ